MKTTHLICIAICSFWTFGTHAQTEKKTAKKKDTVAKKQNNLLDMLSGTLTGAFGEDFDGKSKGLGKGIGYLQLLEKSNLPKKEKEEYRNWYFLQAKEMTQAQKDSLGKALSKKIIEAEHKKAKQ